MPLACEGPQPKRMLCSHLAIGVPVPSSPHRLPALRLPKSTANVPVDAYEAKLDPSRRSDPLSSASTRKDLNRFVGRWRVAVLPLPSPAPSPISSSTPFPEPAPAPASELPLAPAVPGPGPGPAEDGAAPGLGSAAAPSRPTFPTSLATVALGSTSKDTKGRKSPPRGGPMPLAAACSRKRTARDESADPAGAAAATAAPSRFRTIKPPLSPLSPCSFSAAAKVNSLDIAPPNTQSD